MPADLRQSKTTDVFFLPRAKAHDWGGSGYDSDATYGWGKLRAQVQLVTSSIWSMCPFQQHSNGERIWGLNNISTLPASEKNCCSFPGTLCGISQSLQATWDTQTFLSPFTGPWPKFCLSFPQLTWSKSWLQTWPIPWSSFQKQCTCKMVQLLPADKAQSILQSFDDTVCQLRMWKKIHTLSYMATLGKVQDILLAYFMSFRKVGK